MIKIFVTGDNHVGLKYSSHEKASVLAKSRIAAFEKMVDFANSEKCDLFVITGDLFENTYGISKADVKTVLGMLSCFKGTVAVLPGNHDYYDKDSRLWTYFGDAAALSDNILLLSEYRPYELDINDEKVVLYPALCTTLHSEPGQNNLGWIKRTHIPDDGAYHIGIAHGAVEGETIDNEGQYFIMRRTELESIPVDVWLIGHTHVPFPRDLTVGSGYEGRIFNPGTHVQTDVSCNTEGVCFIIEINDDKTVRAKKMISGNIRFYRKNVNVSAGNLESALKRELDGIGDNSVVDIRISGAVTDEEYQNRSDLIGNLLSRFAEGTYNDHSLSRLISKELIDSEFPETSVSSMLLTALLDEPKEAQLAYELLKSLKKGR